MRTALSIGRTVAALLALLALLGAAAGCGTGGDVPGEDGAPVTITHALGTTSVPPNPQRIVALSYEQDLLSQIGVQVVGHNENAVTPGTLFPWEEGEVDLGGSEVVVSPDQEVALERVAALAPDLILATNFSNIERFYEQLSQIAPTVAYSAGWNEDPWQRTATTIGEAVGRPEAVAPVVAGLEQRIAGIAAELPGLRGKRYATAYYYGQGQFVVPNDPDTTVNQVYAALGLQVDPTIVRTVQDRTISAEQVGLLDVDFLQLSTADAATRADLFSGPLFPNLRVVREGRFSEEDQIGGIAQNYPTVLSIPWSLDRQLDTMRRVASEPS